MIIAIDGPAAAGKGTLARMLAEHYGFDCLDTGKLYRAVGLGLMRKGLNPSDAKSAAIVAKSMTPETIPTLMADSEITSDEAGKAASVVSVFPEVRKALLDFQQNYANNPPSGKGAILDGRDIGTVICPNAKIKLFVTASIEKRAERRYKELQERGDKVIYDTVLEDMKVRDARDSGRDTAPLTAAKDALVLDTSDLNAKEVFATVMEHIEKNKAKKTKSDGR